MVFIKKRDGNGIEFRDLAGALLIIFKTNSSVTGSKVSNGISAKEVSGQTVGFGGGKLFLMVRIFSVKYQKRHLGGRQSQTLKEEVTNYFCREWC